MSMKSESRKKIFTPDIDGIHVLYRLLEMFKPSIFFFFFTVRNRDLDVKADSGVPVRKTCPQRALQP